MCASGDFEMIEPLMRMYVDEILPLARYRTRHYFGHGGAYYPECIQFWGDVFNETYGWTPFEQREDPLQVSGWHKWEWVCGPELVFMMLDFYDYTLDEQTASGSGCCPRPMRCSRSSTSTTTSTTHGKLVMHPSQALETWWDCTNPMPELAGLHALTARLLALPERLTTPEQRQFWKALQAKLPPLPTREVGDELALAPAETVRCQAEHREPGTLRGVSLPPGFVREGERRPRRPGLGASLGSRQLRLAAGRHLHGVSRPGGRCPRRTSSAARGTINRLAFSGVLGAQLRLDSRIRTTAAY